MDYRMDQLWPTRVWLGQASADEVVEALASVNRPEDCKLASAVSEIMGELTDLHNADHAPGFNHAIEYWKESYGVGMRYGHGLVRAFIILESNRPEGHLESGAITLHDPRAGAGNVGLPGLPWGRPLKLEAVVGRVAVFPGWLPWSVAPLWHGHKMTVWALSLEAR